MKDYFSSASSEYARFRPSYPPEMFEAILSKVPRKDKAWDCATGNGQVASQLSTHFKSVVGTDISANQLREAIRRDNITYRLEQAEKTAFGNSEFDLVTVGQALHWFGFAEFYGEVRRTLKPDGIIAVFGYTRCKIRPAIDEIVDRLYHGIVGPMWDKERAHVEEEYRTIPFPFPIIDQRNFFARYRWDVEHFLGYLSTWSAVQRYSEKNGSSAVALIEAELRHVWSRDKEEVTFPIFLKMGTRGG